MNTFWLKLASGAIGILIIIVLISMFMPNGDQEPEQQAPPEEPTTSFYEQADIDQEKYLTLPEQIETSDQEPVEQLPEAVEPEQTVTGTVTPPAAPPVPDKPKSNEITIYAKPLGENEKILAERELNFGAPMGSIGRLPVTSNRPMIESARRIIKSWPDSIYAFQAKKMLANLPERDKQQFNITPEEIDTSMFLKSRAGTMPYTVTIEE